MAVLILIIGCFIAGILLRRFKKMPDNAHLVLNNFIIYVSLPALVIKSLRIIPMNSTYFGAALMPWILFAMSVILFLSLEKMRIFDRNTTLALMLTAGLANTSFVGIPMIEALYGPRYIPLAVIIDQMGTFLVVSVVVIPLVDFLRIGEFKLKDSIVNLLVFPPFVALIVAFIFQKFHPPELVYTIAGRIAETLAPLALVSVGLQWQREQMRSFTKQLTIGLTYKLIAAPIIIFLIYTAFNYHHDLRKIVVLEAAMGPMITGGIIAMQKNLNPPLVAAMLSVGIPLSMLTSSAVKLFFR
jgi:malate permease and related proteins